MDRRTLFAIIISLAFLFGWSVFFNKSKDKQAAQEQTTAVETVSENAPAAVASAERQAGFDSRSEILTKDFGLYAVEFDRLGASVRSIRLKNFFKASNERINLIEGLEGRDFSFSPFSVYFTSRKELGRVFYDVATSERAVTFTYRTKGTEGLPAGLVLTKSFSVDTNSYILKIAVSLKNVSGRDIDMEAAGIDSFNINFFDAPPAVKKNITILI